MKKPYASALLLAALLGILLPGKVSALANLTPYQIPGWSGKIVVSPTAGTTSYSGPLYTTNTLNVAFAVANAGNQNVNQTFYIDLNIDGALFYAFQQNGIPASSAIYYSTFSIGSLSAGNHTVQIVADATGVVTNDSGNDQSYSTTITVTPVVFPAPTPLTPVNASTKQSPVPFFSWNPVANAGYYRVLIATNAADLPTSTTATNGGSSVVLNAVTFTTNFSPTITLAANTTYYWEVHASFGSDDGTWSGVQSFTVQPLNNGLTIIPSFDSSITSDPNAATIEATINAAIAVYRADFSDQVTVNFTFTEMDSGLGENETYTQSESYTSFRTALISHATSADDTNALISVPAGSVNPVNGNANMELTLPLARTLGFSAQPPSGEPDSTVYLNTGIMNLSSLETNQSNYSLFSTVSHEMDEALGFGSALNGSINGNAAPTGPVEPEDLFRYDQTGARSFTTSASASAYCSFDGVTDLAQFNQNDTGDFGDWYSYGDVSVTPQVQDAFLGPGVYPVLGVELRILDAIGYTRTSTASTTAAVPTLTALNVTGGSFIFTLSGTVGSNYVVQISTNLPNWLPLSTNTIPAGGSTNITNSIAVSKTAFFRAKSQ